MKVRCVACGKLTADRIINKMYCPSCYNRIAEVRRGAANARGSRPILADQLHVETLVVVDGNAAAEVRMFADVTGLFQVLLRLARNAAGATVAIGRPRWTPPEVAEVEEIVA